MQRGHDGVMRKLIALALLAASLPATANVLYKSVDANGTVMFSDTPPPEGARILEERAIGAPAPSYSSLPGAGAPVNGLEEAYGLIDSDAALAQANARVDMAERALAEARGGAMPRTEGLRLPQATQVSGIANSSQVEFCKRDVKLARQALLDLLRSRQLASGRQPKG
jgi:hypothetical protein